MNRRTRTAWLFLAPMLVLMLIVAAWPLGRSIWFGLTETNINNMAASRFVGLENYFGPYGLFFNPNYTDGFWASDWGVAILNTLKFSVVSVALETLSGLGVALLLNQEFKGRAWVRTAVLVPWAIPTIVSAKMWGWMLHDQFGVINDLFMTLHIISEPIAWTVNPDTVLGTIVAVDVWKTTPFMALLTLAALQMLPKDCYEAARVDGIHPLKVFFKVTLPLIKPALVVAVVFRMLDALRIFDLVYILTSNSEDTIVMSVYARQALIDFQQIGYGSAASTLLFLMVFGLTLAYIFATRLKLDGSGDH